MSLLNQSRATTVGVTFVTTVGVLTFSTSSFTTSKRTHLKRLRNPTGLVMSLLCRIDALF